MSVCSVHSVKGLSSPEHPHPTLHLGLDEEACGTQNPRYRKKPCASSICVELKNKTVMNHVFRRQKLSCLSKIDLSKKGSIDKAVAGLVVFINDCEQYFTTSSCSGRICIHEEVYCCC